MGEPAVAFVILAPIRAVALARFLATNHPLLTE
jgi:hypothetical protein